MGGRSNTPDGGALFTWRTLIGLVLIAVCADLSGGAKAGPLDGWFELSIAARELTGESGETDSDARVQRYNLTFERNLFPNLSMRIGGLFERVDSTLNSGATESETTATSQRPFFDLRLHTPLYLAEFRYSRIENKNGQRGQPSNTDVRDSYISTLAWRPAELPQFRLQYAKIDSYNKNRALLDVTENRIDLTSDYDPIPELQLRYRGSWNETQNHVEDSETRDVGHNARMTYADQWLDRRVSFNSGYNVSYRSTELIAAAGNAVSVPLFALAGLSAIDETPDEGALADNPALIDGNLIAGAGVNLGLPPTGSDDDPRNIGLSLVREEPIDTLSVRIDRELPAEIANSFSWEVYTSEDNEDWLLRQSVAPAVFDPFAPIAPEFRIAISGTLTTRYIKLVVSPLSPDVPFAGDYPTILVTEFQATTELRDQRSDTTHLYNMDVRTRILKSSLLYHELTYFLTKAGSGPTRYTLSNGLSLNHRINSVYRVAARIARENGREEQGSRTGYRYSASLGASALSTLRHRLVFSGRRDDQPDGRFETNSIFLFNEAQLYQGINVNLGVGKSYRESPAQTTAEETRIDASTSLVPHRTMTVNLGYRNSDNRTTGGGRPPTERVAQSATASFAYNPLTTLYLFMATQAERRPDRPRRTTQNFAVNWAPFQDGSLLLSVNYNETFRSDDDSRSRSFIPSLRWSINRRSYLEVAYQKLDQDNVAGDRQTEILSATLRTSF